MSCRRPSDPFGFAAKKMPILAFMQNQWFKDPVGMERMLQTTWQGQREMFIEFWLFYKCNSGKRLRFYLNQAYQNLCSRIVWEESSKRMGGHSSSVYKPDGAHMRDVYLKWKPKVVLLFGQTALDGWNSDEVKSIEFPAFHQQHWSYHPAARDHKKVVTHLTNISERLKEHIQINKWE